MKTITTRPEDIGITDEKVLDVIRSGVGRFIEIRTTLGVSAANLRVLDKHLQAMRRRNLIEFDRKLWAWTTRTPSRTFLPSNAEVVTDLFSKPLRKDKA